MTDTTWYKSSHCNNTTACVEIRRTGTTVGVRDSKDTRRSPFGVTVEAWQAFQAAVPRERV